jgi:hypothetical protein
LGTRNPGKKSPCRASGKRKCEKFHLFFKKGFHPGAAFGIMGIEEKRKDPGSPQNAFFADNLQDRTGGVPL